MQWLGLPGYLEVATWQPQHQALSTSMGLGTGQGVSPGGHGRGDTGLGADGPRLGVTSRVEESQEAGQAQAELALP